MLMLLAMLTMIIDHVGYIFFDNETMRIIGRIAFPLYAFMIVQGYHYTKNYNKYMKRLIILACISQIPYIFAFQTLQLNVIFLFVAALLALYVLDNQKKYIAVPLVISLAFTSEILMIEYGVYGLVLVLIYKYLHGKNIVVAHAILNLLYLALFQADWLIQQFSILASVIIVYRAKFEQIPIKINRTFYRLLYPAHLAVLFLISLIVP